jgi:hypothetical protein
MNKTIKVIIIIAIINLDTIIALNFYDGGIPIWLVIGTIIAIPFIWRIREKDKSK